MPSFWSSQLKANSWREFLTPRKNLSKTKASVIHKGGQKKKSTCGYSWKEMLVFQAWKNRLVGVLPLVGDKLKKTLFYVLFIYKIFGELSDLQEKAKKEGILKNDAEEVTKMRSDENFIVRSCLSCLNSCLSLTSLFFFLREWRQMIDTENSILMT